MPFVSIRILAGHKQETKDRIAKGTVKAITEATGLPEEAVWVVFEDVTGEDWFVGQKTVKSLNSSGKL
ncbi:MAG: tautomerase family protein [Rhizobiales bacterium]|nr:tautomerase family protein [Hyphomicrobiales bacterium]